MMKLMIAALTLMGSTAQATSLVPEINVLLCKSNQQYADYGYTVLLKALPTRPQGMPYLLEVSTMTIAGARSHREFAVERANPRMGGPLYYISNSYSFAVNQTVSPSAGTIPAILRGHNNLEIEMTCVRTR